MAFNVGAIREAVSTRLSAALTSTNCYPREVGTPRLNAIIVRLAPSETVTYFDTMSASGDAVLNLELEVIVGGNDENAQIRLEQYLSCGTGMSYSIHDALEADRTLGGVVTYCVALSATVVPDAVNARAIVPLKIVDSKA